MTHPRIKQDRVVAIWLLLCCGLVFSMVVLGGVTRLTGSGLSMVDWRPVTGFLPPLSQSQWEEVFAGYKESPEFQKINNQMDLSAFKGIFWLEYLHRLLGRTIGIVFLVPFLIFFGRGYITRSQWPRYVLMFALGGLQGLLGWYMVKSGLVNNPHVSQYRLSAHLVAAFGIYAYLLWSALNLLYPTVGQSPTRWVKRTFALLGLTTTTVVSGGFVAGLKAGLAHNTFPQMSGYWIPPGLFGQAPWWRNVFENVTTVQFDHRVLAISTFVAIVAYWYFCARHPEYPRSARRAANVLVLIAGVQVCLGISTLLLHVPIALAAAHQGTALLLFTASIIVCHCVKR